MAGPFDYLLDPSKAPQAPSEGSGTSSPFGYLLDPSKADQSPQDYTQATLTAGQNVRRPWEETAALLKEKGVNPEPHRAGYELGLARVASDKEKEGQSVLGQTVREYSRSYLPFSTVIDSSEMGIGYGTNEYARAKQRFQKGEATVKDYKTIADYERGQAFDARVKSTIGGKVVEGVGTIGGKIGGEVLSGGAALRGFNALRGAGAAAGAEGVAAGAEALAPAAEAALPTLLGSQTLRAGTVSLGKSAGSFVVTPSMWLEDARQRNLQADRDVGDPKGFSTAMGLGFANWLVLGRLQGRIAGTREVGGNILPKELGLFGRLAGAPAVGVGEQALVDVGAHLLDHLGVTEDVLGKGAKFDTKGGLFVGLAKAFEGKGSLSHVGEEALTQFLTFSIAAGLHEAPKVWDAIRGDKKPEMTDAERAAKEKFAAMVKAYDGVADDLMKRGMGKDEAYGLASKYVTDLGRRLTDAGGGGLVKTRSDAEDYLGHLPEGPARDFGKLLASVFPEGSRTERPYAIPLSERAKSPDEIAREGVRKNASIIDEMLAAPPQTNVPYTPSGGGLGFRREAVPATPTPDQVARAKLRGESIPVATAPPIPPSGRTPWQHTAAGQDQPGRVTHEDVARAQAQHDKVQLDVLALSREVSRQEGMNREGLATPDLEYLKDRLDYLTSKLKGHRARLGDMKVALEKKDAIPPPSPPLTHSFPTPTSGVVVGKNVGIGRNVVVGRGGPGTPPEAPGSSPEAKPPETGPTAGGEKTPPATNVEEIPPRKGGYGPDSNGKNEGWKLHLATDHPEEVSIILRQNGLVHHKVGRSDQEGKDLTVYIGSKDAADRAALLIQEKAGHLLKESHGDTLHTNTPFTSKVSGRFDANRAPAPGMPFGSPSEFHQYGGKGFPHLWEDVGMPVWGKEQHPQADARAIKRLTERYGEYYTGSKKGIDPNEVANEYERLKAEGVPPAEAFLRATDNASKLPVREQEKKDVESQLKRTDDAPLADDAKQKLSETATTEGEDSGVRLARSFVEGEASGAAGGEVPAAPAVPRLEGFPGGAGAANTPQGAAPRTARSVVFGRAGAKGGNDRNYVTPEEAKGVPIEHVREILRSAKIPFGPTESQASLVAKFSKLGVRENALLKSEVEDAAREKVTKKVKQANPEMPPEPEPTPIEEREKVIDASDLPKHIKEGMKLLLSENPLSVRDAGRLASQGGKSVTGQTLINHVKELFGKSPFEIMREVRAENEARMGGGKIEFSSAKASKQMRKDSGRSGGESDEGQLFAPAAGTEATGTAPGRVSTPSEVLAEADRTFGSTTYRDSPHGGNPTDIAYQAGPRAVTAGTMAVGDVVRRLHDVAHHVEATNGLETDPAKLPTNVRDGLAEFDYLPSRPMGVVKMKEGFAQWFARRVAGDLTGLTPNQRAADTYLEAWAKRKKLTVKLDKVSFMFEPYRSETDLGKAAARLSPSGESPATHERSTWDKFRESVEDDLHTLTLAERAQIAAGGKPSAPGKDLHTVFAQTLFRNKQDAREFEEHGYFTYEGGKKVTLGIPLAKMIEGYKPEWVTPYGRDAGRGRFKEVLGIFTDPNRASPLDVYLVAKHAISEKAAKRQFLPDDQQATFERAYSELMADPEFAAWAKPTGEKITKYGFNAGLHALAAPEVHRLSPEFVKNSEAKRPDYVPTTRVKDEFDTRVALARSRGTALPEWTKPRSGSGEPVVAPLVSLKMRYKAVANQINAQRRMNALADFARKPGSGEFVLAGVEEAPTTGVRLRKDLVDELGGEERAVMDALKSTGGEDLFTFAPWPSDGSKPTIPWFGPGGKKTNMRVGDESLYNLVTGQQVDANQVARIANFVSNLSVGGVKPFKALQQAQRTGATVVKASFQFANVFKDAVTLLTNSIKPGEAARSVVEALRRSYRYEMDVLTGRASKDEVFKYFMENRGREQKMFAFDPFDKGSVYEQYGTPKGGAIPFVKNKWSAVKQLFNVMGAGENGPRFIEWRARMGELGWPEVKVKEAIQKAKEEHEAGGRRVDPIDESLKDDALRAASEVTVPFNRQGVATRQLNAIHPFFGPAVSGLSKSMRNWKTNTKGAAVAMGAFLGVRLLHWLYARDEEWYKELNPYDRYRTFVVDIPGLGRRRLPAPRDLEVPAGAFMLAALDAATDRHPEVKGAVSEAWDALSPSLPITPAGKALLDIERNKNFMDRPVVPHRDEDLSRVQKTERYYGPYAARELSGGVINPKELGKGNLGSLVGLPLVSEVKGFSRSIDEFYERRKDLQEGYTLAKTRGERFDQEAERHRIESVASKMTDLNHRMRGDRKAGDKWVKGDEPNDDEKKKINAQMTALAKQALGQK